jgi:hypothetical protein
MRQHDDPQPDAAAQGVSPGERSLSRYAASASIGVDTGVSQVGAWRVISVIPWAARHACQLSPGSEKRRGPHQNQLTRAGTGPRARRCCPTGSFLRRWPSGGCRLYARQTPPIKRSTLASVDRRLTAARTPQPLCQSRTVSSLGIRWAAARTACHTVGVVVNSPQVRAERCAAALGGVVLRPRLWVRCPRQRLHAAVPSARTSQHGWLGRWALAWDKPGTEISSRAPCPSYRGSAAMPCWRSCRLPSLSWRTT